VPLSPSARAGGSGGGSPLVDEELAPPVPQFAKRVSRPGAPRSNSQDSFASGDSDVEEAGPSTPFRGDGRHFDDGAGAVDSEDDFVMFEGESEVQTKVEADLSSKVKKEGKLRRANSRRTADSKWAAKFRPLSHRSNGGDHNIEHPSEVPKHLSATAESGSTSPSPYSTSLQSHSPSGSNFRLAGAGGSPRDSVDFIAGEQHSPTTPMSASFRHLIAAMSEDRDIPIDMLPAEQEDLDVVAELAQATRPNLGALLDEEKERAEGRIMVACSSSSFFLPPLSLGADFRFSLCAHRLRSDFSEYSCAEDGGRADRANPDCPGRR
jgi:hypothetical protein